MNARLLARPHRSPSLRLQRLASAVAALVGLTALPAAAADGTVRVLVLKEHGVGSAAQAQPFVDKLVALAARHNGWADAKGEYLTTRAAAEKAIEAQPPRYAILSLGAFLGLRATNKLDVLGQVSAARAGGQQYHLISKAAADRDGCKGKRLASDHADDARFIENVVFAGKIKLADFTLVPTTRPLQTVKKVLSGDAECALIDDAQLSELPHIEGASGVRSVWASEKLPPMAVVAFPSAPAAERKAFQQSLGKLCDGDGKAVCAEVGIQSLKPATAADYQATVSAYEK